MARPILNEYVCGGLLEIVVVAEPVRLETVVAKAVGQTVVQPGQSDVVALDAVAPSHR
ncbi:hypothetical protein D3C83_280510 [compost metagenome]